MKKKLVIAIVTLILASLLAVPQDSIKPVVDAVYCKINAADCAAEKEN